MIAAPYAIEAKKEPIDEYLVNYDDGKDDKMLMIKFLKSVDKSVVICYNGKIDMDTMKIFSECGDVSFEFESKSLDVMSRLHGSGLRYFFKQPATSFVTLADYIAFGVSQVYIFDDLCFDMKTVKRLCSKSGIKLRVVLNRIPSTALVRGADVRDMVYQPNMIDDLSRYFETFEFDCGEPYSWAKFDGLYAVFFKDKKFYGDMSSINADVRIEYPVAFVPNNMFGKLNCQRMCDASSCCTRCHDYINLGRKLRKGIQNEEHR